MSHLVAWTKWQIESRAEGTPDECWRVSAVGLWYHRNPPQHLDPCVAPADLMQFNGSKFKGSLYVTDAVPHGGSTNAYEVRATSAFYRGSYAGFVARNGKEPELDDEDAADMLLLAGRIMEETA
jgi:hypothetical protein